MNGNEASGDSALSALVGINHVALEVGDVDEAIAFYRDLFAFEIRGRNEAGAFLDMGDQFLALAETDSASNVIDQHRHVGLVVSDLGRAKRRLDTLGIDRRVGRGVDFQDPWGNRIQLVEYEAIQFTKADHVLGGMGLAGMGKTESAIEELSEKGMAPDVDSDPED